jgi:hypothetical protein
MGLFSPQHATTPYGTHYLSPDRDVVGVDLQERGHDFPRLCRIRGYNITRLNRGYLETFHGIRRAAATHLFAWRSTMSKDRLEAFNNGVLASSITILGLSLRTKK